MTLRSLFLGCLAALSAAGTHAPAHRGAALRSVPITSTVENSTCALGAWKKGFQGGEIGYRAGASIRNKTSSPSGPFIRIAIVPHGEAAPSATDPEDDTQFVVYPGDTQVLGDACDTRCDIYLRASDDTAAPYRLWETKK